MKQALNNRIISIQDLSDEKYPLLAVIYSHSILNKKKTKKLSEPSNSKSKKISEELVLYHYGLSPIAESYRSLVSKILYSHPDNPPKTILITSPGAGEGKTTLTANMAVAFSEMGKRVLIIDCDLRRPGIPKFFGVSKEPGIMEILFEDDSPEDAVRSTPIPGLDILTTGKKQPARPNSVISSHSFKKLIEKFKFEYDFVLLDSAPFGIIGDVAPILHLTDGVIVNTKFMATKHIELNYTIDQLEKNSAQIMGVVLNGYNPQKSVDDSEIKGLYDNLYSGYYDYHETPTKKKKKSNVKFL
jgi:capsular exopolysaccharide synthesis family protein